MASRHRVSAFEEGGFDQAASMSTERLSNESDRLDILQPLVHT